MKLTQKQLSEFKKTILDFYTANKREFDWRNTTDPYKIMVSEFMLQQTQTARVIEKYKEFLTEFPTLSSLANAKLETVLRLWQGLGYNRRAKFLFESTKLIQEHFEGVFPLDFEELDKLPGIGPYTARAIYTFSTNKPTIFIETNIRTVFIHFFFKDSQIPDKQILELVEQTLDTEQPRQWYYALMDYGVFIKKTIGNVNVQSKHYAKQSKFEGSKRQVRGEIIRLLLQHKKLSENELSTKIKTTYELQKILFGLVNEGLVQQSANNIFTLHN